MIIGNLGYPEDRRIGQAQVCLLDTDSFHLACIDTHGESPGWIHDHHAQLSADETVITLTGGKLYLGDKHSLRENIDDWELDLKTWAWKRLTKRRWPRWEVLRVDRKRIHLSDIRQALWNQSVNWVEQYEDSIKALAAELGREPQVSSVKELYSFPLNDGSPIDDEEEHDLFWIYISGVKVRFIEEHFALVVTVAGELPDSMIGDLQQILMERLSALENAPCELQIY